MMMSIGAKMPNGLTLRLREIQNYTWIFHRTHDENEWLSQNKLFEILQCQLHNINSEFIEGT